ncbi:MAG: zinc-finger domain-containing protein [Gammaproteobacteria bacterium]|nr:zinc-finger domain-containing protein [Gammaproteobacteria bacterium]
MPNKETNNRYEITTKDLPIQCPMDNMTHWNSHPRVFIGVTADKPGKCPYCGNEYVLVEKEATDKQENS